MNMNFAIAGWRMKTKTRKVFVRRIVKLMLAAKDTIIAFHPMIATT